LTSNDSIFAHSNGSLVDHHVLELCGFTGFLQSSEISEMKINIDPSAFAELYAAALTSLDKLTPHQRRRLDKAEKDDKNVNLPIKAPAVNWFICLNNNSRTSHSM
jgi:hypothetical protein